MTMPVTNNGVMWHNMLHFSGFRHASSRLKALAMTSARIVIARTRSEAKRTKQSGEILHFKPDCSDTGNKPCHFVLFDFFNERLAMTIRQVAVDTTLEQ